MKDVIDIEKKELKKHVSAIRISNDIGLLGRKTWNALLFNAYDDILRIKKHEIPISVLSDVIGYNSKSYKTLDHALIKLQTTLVEWDIGRDATNKGYWNTNIRRTQMLGGISIIDGVIEYEYPSGLPELLYKPSMYQVINIAQQRLFKGTYSLALWENASRFLNTGTTGWSDVEEWRKLLGANAKTYDMFKHFKNRVLVPSVKEINEVSDINIQLKVRKFRRKVVSIGFDVKENNGKTLKTNKDIREIKDSSQYKFLTENGIHKIKAISFIEQYGFNYIKEKIDYTQKQDKAGKLKTSLSGFLIRAIEDNYKTPENLKAEKEQREKARKAQEEEWEKQLNQARKEAIDHYLENLNEAQKERLKTEFEQSKAFQYSMMNDHYLHSVYRDMNTLDEVLKHKAIQKIIRAFIFYDCLENIEHLKNLDTWKQHHHLN